MIKINLVSEGRKPIVARKAKEALGVGETQLGELLFMVFLALGFVFIGAFWWYYNGEIKQREAQIAEAQREVDELALVLQEVEDFKKKKAELEHKIDVINGLKQAQKGPVKIMDLVSGALPELLWLENMRVRGNNVEVSGQAFNTNQVATFIENLNKVPEFQEPQLRETSKGGQDIYRFRITFDFSFAPPPSAEGEGAATQSAAGG